MRISDWSSDVCSSDLSYAGSACGHCGAGAHSAWSVGLERDAISFAEPASFRWRPARFVRPRHRERIARRKHQCRRVLSAEEDRYAPFHGDTIHRSEEHTSELQSLMRISYAVFCLKKKNKTN